MAKKIVIIDDDETCRFLYRHHFREVSEVEIIAEFENAEEALEQIPKLMPEVVIVDYTLPGMTGIEFAENMIQWPHIKILLSTGHGSDFIKRRLPSTCNVTIVQKNWSSGSLERIIGLL